MPSPSKGSAQTGTRATPQHRLIVVPWLKSFGQRFIMRTWLAITIRTWIIAWRDLDEAELAHELVHVRQWHENGFLGYVTRYMSESSRARKRGGDRYRDNPFEAEARKAEEAVRRRTETRTDR